MKTTIWKIVGSVLAVVVVGVLAFCTVWTVRNWNVVYQSLDGTSIYTATDVKKAEEDAWAKAALNETEYQKTIADLRDSMAAMQIDFDKQKKELENQIEELRNQYQVNFVADGKIVETQSVTAGSSVSLPEIPTKEGYDFAGWTLDPTETATVNVESIAITGDTNYYAYYLPHKYIWKLMADNIETTDRYVGASAKIVSRGSKYYILGSANQVVYDTGTKEVTELNLSISNVEPADFWYCNGLLVYVHGSERCVVFDDRVDDVGVPTGSYEIYGRDIWSYVDQYGIERVRYDNWDQVNGHLFDSYDGCYNCWREANWSGDFVPRYGRNVWSLNGRYFYSEDSNHYELNLESMTWSRVYFGGDFDGKDVWVYDGHAYTNTGIEIDINNMTCCRNNRWELVSLDRYYDSTLQMNIVLDNRQETHYIENVWNCNGDCVMWSRACLWVLEDGDSFVTTMTEESDNHELIEHDKVAKSEHWDLASNLCIPTADGYVNFNGRDIVEYDGVLYAFVGGDHYALLNEESWTYNPFRTTCYVDGEYVWNTNDKLYYDNNKVIEQDGDLLRVNKVNWQGLTQFNSRYIWHRGNDTYYNHGAYSYKLDGNTWTKISWNLDYIDGSKIWYCDGHTYHTDHHGTYVLAAGNLWQKVKWQGLEPKDGRHIWVHNGHAYYSESNIAQLELIDNEWVAISWGSNGAIQYFYGEDVWEYNGDAYVTQSGLTYKLVA